MNKFIHAVILLCVANVGFAQTHQHQSLETEKYSGKYSFGEGQSNQFFFSKISPEKYYNY